MISRQKSQFYVAILRPQALLRHTNVAQERNQKLCLLSEIDGNVCLHREGKVLETGLSKKLRLDASKNRGLELACLENPVWENETPTIDSCELQNNHTHIFAAAGIRICLFPLGS